VKKFKWACDQEAVTDSLATSPFDPEMDRRWYFYSRPASLHVKRFRKRFFPESSWI